MIFYFSATGNSKYVATRLAQATNDTIVSIVECLKTGSFEFDINENERIGFVTPTYNWGLPTVVIDFLEQMNLGMTGKHYIYHVLTYGTSTGQAHQMMSKNLVRKGMSLDGKFMIRMVDTWTPIFNLSDKEKNKKITDAAEDQITDVIDKVKMQLCGDYNHSKLPRMISAIGYSQYSNGRKTRKFQVEDSCIGCSLCAKICPVGAIEIRNDKPVWIKNQCTLCLGCLHRCPKFAIQYGKCTKKHGQFVNPNVKL